MTTATLDVTQRTWLACCQHYAPCNDDCLLWGSQCGMAECRECGDRVELSPAGSCSMYDTVETCSLSACHHWERNG